LHTNFALHLHSFDQRTVNIPGHCRWLFTSFWPCWILGLAGTVLTKANGPGRAGFKALPQYYPLSVIGLLTLQLLQMND